jgi:hypothetical protein
VDDQPNIAHTLFWEKRGLELDNYVGFDVYAKNPLTRYKSGTVFHWDGMLVQYLSKKFGFGAIVSNLTQITNDTGPWPRDCMDSRGGPGAPARWSSMLPRPRSQASRSSSNGSPNSRLAIC